MPRQKCNNPHLVAITRLLRARGLQTRQERGGGIERVAQGWWYVAKTYDSLGSPAGPRWATHQLGKWHVFASRPDSAPRSVP
jgi:hypothetical protein